MRHPTNNHFDRDRYLKDYYVQHLRNHVGDTFRKVRSSPDGIHYEVRLHDKWRRRFVDNAQAATWAKELWQ